MPWKSETNIWSLAIALCTTLLGALASYAYRVLSGEIFSWVTLGLQIIVSVFAGVMMVFVAVHYEWPTELLGGACGMAGWSGASLVKAVERRILARLGGSNANQ